MKTDAVRRGRIEELLRLRILVADLVEMINGRLQALGYEPPGRAPGARPPTFLGQRITRQKILDALESFDSQYPDANDYDSWLEKRTYKYAVQYRGKLYPCKFILSLARDCALSDFGAGQAKGVFRRLGFEVIDKPTL